MRLNHRIILNLTLLFFCTAHHASGATPIDGLYIQAHGGISYTPGNINLVGTFTNARYRAGFDAGGELGIKSGPFRYGLQGFYNENKPRRFDFSGVRQTAISGKAKSTTLLMGVYYDFESFSPSLAPFLGVGIGVTRVNTHLDSNVPNDVSFNKHKNMFSYSGQCGITYNFAEDFAVAIAYQYLRTDKVDRFNDVYQTHLGNFSVTYHFDN